jgi:hypothetical protein
VLIGVLYYYYFYLTSVAVSVESMQTLYPKVDGFLDQEKPSIIVQQR